MTRAVVAVALVVALLLLALWLIPPDSDAPQYPYLPTPQRGQQTAPAPLKRATVTPTPKATGVYPL